MSYTVYILRTSGNTLYTGQTNDIARRLKEHQAKKTKSAKYLRRFTSVTLVYTENYESIGDAIRREIEIKNLTKAKKEKLVQGK